MDIRQIMMEYHQTSEQGKREIEKRVRQKFSTLSDPEKAQVQKMFLAGLDGKINEADALIREMNMKLELENISGYVSMSYIAKRFFGKSRQWLNNRIKGNLVNGMPARFSEEELSSLSSALLKLSGEIKETALRITP
jgi:hypothetical protein